MKIIINAYQYSSQITGTDRMAYNFLRELQKLDSKNEYFIVCSAEKYIQSIISEPNFKILQPKHRINNPLAVRLVNKLWRTFIVTRLKPINADVYFSFHNMQLPDHKVAKRLIASNLDLIPFVLDEYKTLVPGQAETIKKSAHTADAFMSISNYSKQELCNTLAVPAERVHVIHLAADPELVSSKADPSNFLRPIPKNFILTIGGSEPRKNVSTVVDAFCKLPLALQKQYPLLIAGGSWHGIPIDKYKKNDHIIPLGFVSDEELALLYKRATVFVFASKYEGFGFTVLEAMACGAPTISANSSSLPEVTGDAALLFSPEDTESLTQYFKDILTDEILRKNLITAGKKQSSLFTWEKSAKKLHDLLTSTD